MQERSVSHATFVIERTYPGSPEVVFRAFAEKGKKQRWFAEGEGSELQEFDMDFRVGGKETTRFRATGESPVQGMVFTNETTYQDIVPGKRIVLAYTMAMGSNRISASLSTFELLPSGEGTNLIFTEQAAFFEGADGPVMREQGWAELLDSLGRELTRP